MLRAIPAFVEVQLPRAESDDGFYIAQAIVIDDSGLVLVAQSEIEDAEQDPLYGGEFDYQAALYSRDSDEITYVPMRRIGSVPEFNLMVFKLQYGAPWAFAEIADPANVQIGDEVYSMGIQELTRYTGSTAADTANPLVVSGTITSLENNEGIDEIVHSIDLSEIPGGSPLLNSNGQLIGFNSRIVRLFGPDGVEPGAYATASHVFADAVREVAGISSN